MTIDVEMWLSTVESLPFLTFVPVDNRVALRAIRLAGFAQIVATAPGLGATLVTADARLRGYKPLSTVWG